MTNYLELYELERPKTISIFMKFIVIEIVSNFLWLNKI